MEEEQVTAANIDHEAIAMMNSLAEAEDFAATEPVEGIDEFDTTIPPVETEVVDLSPTVTIIEQPTIKISDILSMLKRGFARTPKEKCYDAAIGSISEHYGFDTKQIKEIFEHPKLKGKKTIRVKNEVASITIIDDTESETTTEENN